MQTVKRVFNFSAGPSAMPQSVLKDIQSEFMSWNNTGLNVMEMSHRSKNFQSILDNSRDSLRKLMQIPDNYHILFLQGGASMQNSMIPMSFLPEGSRASYLVTGVWGKKSYQAAKMVGEVDLTLDTSDSGYNFCPSLDDINVPNDVAYMHYTSNETIQGVTFQGTREWNVPVVCDMSSDIASKPIDVNHFDLIYAGAQKNMGPSGVTIVIIKDSFLQKAPEKTHPMFDYRLLVENGSMYNTPPTWGIYVCGKMVEWLLDLGGLPVIEKINQEKAAIIYESIDQSDGFYTGHAEKCSRSLMNITFNLPSEELSKRFIAEAGEKGFIDLKGHRSVGGCRTSIYNAFPKEGCVLLAEFMQDFRKKC